MLLVVTSLRTAQEMPLSMGLFVALLVHTGNRLNLLFMAAGNRRKKRKK